MVHEAVVKVFTTKVRVTSGGLDLEDTLLNREQGYIECTTTQIEDEHILLSAVLLVETVGNSSSRWLVDDTHHIEASNDTSILGSLTLRVVEVSRHRDDGILHFAAEVGSGSFTHLQEDHRRDFFRREDLLLTLVFNLDDWLARAVHNREWPVLHVRLHISIRELAANKTLGVEHSVMRVHGHLVLGGITDQTLSVCETDVRRRRTVTLVVGDNLNTVVLPDSHTRVGGTQINTNSFCHDSVVVV